jgi:hypothetical protein
MLNSQRVAKILAREWILFLVCFGLAMLGESVYADLRKTPVVHWEFGWLVYAWVIPVRLTVAAIRVVRR